MVVSDGPDCLQDTLLETPETLFLASEWKLVERSDLRITNVTNKPSRLYVGSPVGVGTLKINDDFVSQSLLLTQNVSKPLYTIKHDGEP